MPACGPGRIRLIDYQGKVVLVTFSANITSAARQNLKDTYQRFHENPQYAQVGLLFAGNPMLTAKAIDEAGLDWPQGLLEWQGNVVTEYGVETTPWNVLIGAQGEVLATGLSGEALNRAIEAALAVDRR